MHSKRICQTAGTEQMWLSIQAKRLSLQNLQLSTQIYKPGPILHLHHPLASLRSALHPTGHFRLNFTPTAEGPGEIKMVSTCILVAW